MNPTHTPAVDFAVPCHADWLVADTQDAAIAELVRDVTLPQAHLPAGVEPLAWLSGQLEGVAVDTLHLVAHGAPGVVMLGGRQLDESALRAAAPLLARWQVRRIALWSCSVGRDSAFVRTLQQLTGADVLASDEAIGQVQGRLQWTLSGHLHGARVFGAARIGQWAHQLAYLTVSFANGFAGDNGGTNATNYSFSFNALGWTQAQFAQNSSGTIFTAQGNDIIGSVLLTDFTGHQVSVPGFIKWRTPSGNSPSTLVFQPDSSVHLNLDTNPGGAYGGGTFPIDNTFYLGLTFNGQSLSFNEGDPINGNAATSGLLDVLNNYLAAQPQLSINDVTVGEGGGTVTFTVSLSAASGDTITVKYDTSNGTATGGSDYTGVTNGSLSFAPGQTSKTITVNVTDDASPESSETFNVVLRDPTFAAIADNTGVGTITDNDATPGLVLGAPSAHTTEAGGTATFTVALATAPSANVTVTVGSSDTTEGTASPATLTFTPANWNTPQTVTVTGVDDALIDGNIAYNATLSTSSSDAGYNGLSGSVAVTNDDNDTASLVAGVISRHTTEGGQTATFTLQLSSQPSADVTVSVTSNDTTEGTVSVSTLTFTPANWNTPQTVTVTGVDDAPIDGNINYTVGLSATSGDGNYQGKTASVAVVNDDNDTASLVAGAISRHTTEGGQTATFTLQLSSQPSADVTVTVTSNDTSEGTVSTSTLTFTAANWNTPQTVTVTGVDDPSIDGDINYTVGLSAASADGNYQGKTASVAVTNDDNDTASLVAGAISRHTAEGGQTATFTLQLSSQPSANVTVSVTSNDTTEGTVSTSTVTFTPANWNSPQTVTVTGVDDLAIDGAIGYAVDLSATSADGNYQGKTAAVAVTNDDNDMAAIVVSAATRHTTEAGQTASFTVALGAQPTANVTVTVANSDTTEGSLSTTTLTFTPANWNTPQTVTATGVDDDFIDGAQPYQAQLTSASSDSNFAGLAATVALVNDDNDSATLRVSQATLRTGEDGSWAGIDVSLASRPSANVTIAVRSSDPAEGSVGPTTLTFTPANWSLPQSVRVQGVDDLVIDGDQPYYVLLDASSADSNFNGASGAVAVINTDNDKAGLVLGAKELSTSEDGASDSFELRLRSQPKGEVIVTVTSSAPGEAVPQTQTLRFDATDWNLPHRVQVSGVDDPRVDGAQPFTVQLSSQSADPAYQGLSAQVVGRNADNDSAGLVLSADALRTREDGSSASFTVRLASKPTGPVTVDLGVSDDTEGRIDLRSIVFTPDDWQTPRSVTVTGVDDRLVDGTVRHAVQIATHAADPAYEGLSRSVTIDNDDDDKASLILDRAALRTDEGGGTDTAAVRLSNRPQQPVTVSVSVGADAEGHVLTTTLVFTPDNWDQPQTLKVQGVDDPVVDGDRDYRVQLRATSADPAFDGLAAALEARNADNDHAGLVLDAAANLVTGEDGRSASFAVRLASRPLSPVTVTLNTSDGTEGRPATTQIVFTPDDWDQPRTVRVDGVDDKLVDGSVPYAVTLAASSADPAYQGQAARVDLHNEDDDTESHDTQPGFGVDGDARPGDTARLIDPSGHVVADAVLTTEQVEQGGVVVTPPSLDDGTYTFMAQVLGPNGELRSERPVTVTIVTDRDGVMPSVEQAAHGGDINGDGVPDWQQNNVTQLPLRSLADQQAGAHANPASFGGVMAGGASGSGAVVLDPGAQLQEVGLHAPSGALPPGLSGGSPVLGFTLTSQTGSTWRDDDGRAPGHQSAITIELPAGAEGNSVLLWDGIGQRWVQVLGRGFSSPAQQAELVDSDGDGRPNRLILRITDGGEGDGDGAANGQLQVAVRLAEQPPTPVLCVRLPTGERLMTTDPAQAATWAQGDGPVFEGAWFDSLTPAEGGVPFVHHWQPITQDHTWAAPGQALPYACYVAQPETGFAAALPTAKAGSEVHLYLQPGGMTQLFTTSQASALGLAAQGYRDLGVQLRTTTESAFGFDPEGYLVNNRGDASVQQLVATLSQRFTSTRAPGFVDAVEQHYLAQVSLIGLPHGDSADAAAVNAAFGTHFGA